jgi:hypothetical protein
VCDPREAHVLDEESEELLVSLSGPEEMQKFVEGPFLEDDFRV